MYIRNRLIPESITASIDEVISAVNTSGALQIIPANADEIIKLLSVAKNSTYPQVVSAFNYFKSCVKNEGMTHIFVEFGILSVEPAKLSVPRFKTSTAKRAAALQCDYELGRASTYALR